MTTIAPTHWTPILPSCAMANSDLKPPFFCPLDHIFNPVTFFKGAQALGVDVREIGFIDDLRVSEEIRGDVARVKVGEFFVPGKSVAGKAGSTSAAEPDAVIGRSWLDSTIAVKLKPLEDRRVIELSDMASALCGLQAESDNASAERVMYNGDRLASGRNGGILNGFDWCCWNPLKEKKGYRPESKPFIMPPMLGTECRG
mmetsp:Transcript_30801/g.76624  ORF Transcript_30801/g.76624 Transcript_30801/m.76624 type:complete len:200 (-) Transcript_30801:137-736(-)